MEKFDEKDGRWITFRGRKIFIRSGESLGSAVSRSGKFENLTRTKLREKRDELSEKDRLENHYWNHIKQMKNELSPKNQRTKSEIYKRKSQKELNKMRARKEDFLEKQKDRQAGKNRINENAKTHEEANTRTMRNYFKYSQEDRRELTHEALQKRLADYKAKKQSNNKIQNNNDEFDMRKYTIELQHDKGTKKIDTVASSKESAIKSVLKSENAPDSAVKSVKDNGSILNKQSNNKLNNEYTRQELKDKYGTDDVELINAGKEKENRVKLIDEKQSNNKITNQEAKEKIRQIGKDWEDSINQIEDYYKKREEFKNRNNEQSNNKVDISQRVKDNKIVASYGNNVIYQNDKGNWVQSRENYNNYVNGKSNKLGGELVLNEKAGMEALARYDVMDKIGLENYGKGKGQDIYDENIKKMSKSIGYDQSKYNYGFKESNNKQETNDKYKVKKYGDTYIALKNGHNEGEFETEDEAKDFLSKIQNNKNETIKNYVEKKKSNNKVNTNSIIERSGKVNQKTLKSYADDGIATDITRYSENDIKKLEKKHGRLTSIKTSMGTYGMNGMLLKSEKTGEYFVITARNTNIFRF